MNSTRLKTLASFVPRRAVLADVCCDHAKIPMYLLQCGHIDKAIACDLRDAPLEAARRVRDEMGFQESQLSLRRGDGLTPLKIGEADVLLISGIGGRLMMDILSKNISLMMSFERLILSPQRHLFDVRTWLSGYAHFEDEVVIREGQKWYEVLVLRPGSVRSLTPTECYFGPCLLKKYDADTQAYFTSMRQRDERLLSIQSKQNRSYKNAFEPHKIALKDLWAEWERVRRCIK